MASIVEKSIWISSIFREGKYNTLKKCKKQIVNMCRLNGGQLYTEARSLWHMCVTFMLYRFSPNVLAGADMWGKQSSAGSFPFLKGLSAPLIAQGRGCGPIKHLRCWGQKKLRSTWGLCFGTRRVWKYLGESVTFVFPAPVWVSDRFCHYDRLYRSSRLQGTSKKHFWP